MIGVRQLLRRWHLLDPFDPEDVDRAQTENAFRDQGTILARLESSDNGRRKAQSSLKDSVDYFRRAAEAARQPKSTSDAIATLIHDMRSLGQARKD